MGFYVIGLWLGIKDARAVPVYETECPVRFCSFISLGKLIIYLVIFWKYYVSANDSKILLVSGMPVVFVQWEKSRKKYVKENLENRYLCGKHQLYTRSTPLPTYVKVEIKIYLFNLDYKKHLWLSKSYHRFLNLCWEESDLKWNSTR